MAANEEQLQTSVGHDGRVGRGGVVFEQFAQCVVFDHLLVAVRQQQVGLPDSAADSQNINMY